MVGGVAAVSAANVGTAAAIRAHAVISCLTAVCQRERRVKKKAVIAAKAENIRYSLRWFPKDRR